jgi:hypothetical protein
MPFFYRSGEQIITGDCVRLGNVSGEIELIADPAEDPNDWHVTEYGGGVMFKEPKVYGRLFIRYPFSERGNDEDDLILLSRRAKNSG